jgi:ABC-type lipoprotein export system ATPase subunit
VVNSTIKNTIRDSVYFVDLKETNIPLLDMVLKGEFVALYGASGSGKSTRVVQVMEELESQGLICI